MALNVLCFEKRMSHRGLTKKNLFFKTTSMVTIVLNLKLDYSQLNFY